MKVNVLQVEQVKFKKFHWWCCWVDVAVFNYESTPFLLQMKVSRLNKKKFNAIRITGKFAYRQATTQEIGDLMPMAKIS